jgi:hypothetical protein
VTGPSNVTGARLMDYGMNRLQEDRVLVLDERHHVHQLLALDDEDARGHDAHVGIVRSVPQSVPKRGPMTIIQ